MFPEENPTAKNDETAILFPPLSSSSSPFNVLPHDLLCLRTLNALSAVRLLALLFFGSGIKEEPIQREMQ